MASQELEVAEEADARLARRLTQRSRIDDPDRDAEILRHEAGEGAVRAYTDVGNALRLADEQDGHILYSKALGWLVWDGRRWKRDDAARVSEMAKKIPDLIRSEDEEVGAGAAGAIARAGGATDAEVAYAEAQARYAINKWATTSEGASHQAAIERLARSDARLVLGSVNDLDAIDNALNVRNGVLDLDTGELVPHHPQFRLTKIANAEYHDDAECPHWRKTLELFIPDVELREWVQMAMGYSMLGRYSEWLFIPYGGGANGKSTILNAVRHVLGEYAGEAAPELLSEKREQTPASDSARAGLRGMRFVTTVETGRGRHLAEVLMKQLTGESTLSAKYMGKDYFEFQNQTAVWLATNHKPVVQGSDLGIWRRMRLIPFTTTLSEDQRRDPAKINEELEAESDGILRWLVEGLRMYRERGGSLDPAPKAVVDATSEYKDEMSNLGEWIEDCCELDPGNREVWATIKEVRQSYIEHCEQSGRFILGPVNFNNELRALGCRNDNRYRQVLGKKTKVWEGIRIVNDYARGDLGV
jgi:putative DNA primase/helicase